MDDIEESVVRFAPRTRPYIFWKNSNGKCDLYYSIEKEFQEFRRQSSQSLVLMNGVLQELTQLSKHYSLILAGQYGKNIYDLLRKHNIDQLFQNRLSQDDFDITKPDPRYIELIAAKSGFKPSECIMIGDRIDNDIVPAKQNKMGTVFVKTGIYKNQMPRDYAEIPDVTLESIIGMANKISEQWC